MTIRYANRSTRPRPEGRAPTRSLVGMVLVVLLGLGWYESSALPTTAAQSMTLPQGRWTTFANGDDVLSLHLSGDVLWSGTRAGGLVRHDLTDGSEIQYLRPQDPIGGNTVREIVEAPDGRLWLATDGGVTVFSDGGTPERTDDWWHTYSVELTDGALPSDEVQALALAGDTVWVGTSQVHDPVAGRWSGGGLVRVDTRGTDDPSDDLWSPVATFENTYVTSPTGDDKVGLVSNNILDLAVNDDGDVWVATSPHWSYETQQVGETSEQRWTRIHGGISFLDTAGTFETDDDVWTASSCEDMQETVTCTVQVLEIDPSGMVWAAIGGRGVMYFSADEPRIIDERSRRYSEQGPIEARDPLKFVEAIAFGPEDDAGLAGSVWLGQRGKGLSVLDPGESLRNRNDDRWNFGRGAPFGPADGLSRERVQAVVLGRGKAWLGTGTHNGVAGGVHPLDLVDQTIGGALRTDGAPPSNFITDIAFGQDGSRWEGHAWVATGSRHQRRFGAGVADLDTRGTATVTDDVWTTYRTRGTDSDGMAPWTGLVGDNVHALAVRGDHVFIGSMESTWNSEKLGYDDGGLSVFDGTTWTARTVGGTGGPESGLRDGSVAALAVGCDGKIWAGTGNPWDFVGAGIDVLETGQSVHVTSQDTWTHHNYVDKDARNSLPSRNITAISADCDERTIWASGAHHVRLPGRGGAGGSMTGGGVAAFDLDADPASWTRYDSRHGLETYHSGDELLGEAMSVFAGGLPGPGALVGTYGTSATSNIQLVRTKPYWPAVLNHWDGSAWEATVFEGAGVLSGIARDHEGRTWAGTSRGGIAWDSTSPELWGHDHGRGGLMVGRDGAWITMTMRMGLPSNDISVVRVDPDGNIWIGTEGWGLARFEPGAGPTPTATVTRRARTATPTETGGLEFTQTPQISATATPDGTARTMTPTPRVGPGGTPGPIYVPFTRKRSWP